MSFVLSFNAFVLSAYTLTVVPASLIFTRSQLSRTHKANAKCMCVNTVESGSNEEKLAVAGRAARSHVGGFIKGLLQS